MLIILRGLPGSGKSYLAKSIVRSTVGGDPNQFIFSCDDYFVILGKVVYQFDPSKIMEAHCWNKNRVLSVLKAGVSPVFVDNTSIQSWEMEPYVAMGIEYGYLIEVLEPNTLWSRNLTELARRNSQGVSEDTIRRMDLFEHNITGPELIEQLSLLYLPDKVPPQLRNFPLFEAAHEGQENLGQTITSVGI